MPELLVQHIVSCSSEEKNNPAENLLKHDGSHKWKCATAGEKNISVVFQLTKSSQISSIDIGNEGSAFVEVLVGKATAATDTEFEVLLVASSFMTPLESRNGTNRTAVRMFGLDKLNKITSPKRWDQIKVVCNQPFNKLSTYGLSFIKFHGPSTGEPEVKKFGSFTMKEDSEEDFKVGSLFANRSKLIESPLPAAASGAAALRAATRLVDEGRLMGSVTPLRDTSSSPSSTEVFKKNDPSSSHSHQHDQASSKAEWTGDCQNQSEEKKQDSRKREAASPPPQRSKPKVPRGSHSDSDDESHPASKTPSRKQVLRQSSNSSASSCYSNTPSVKHSHTVPEQKLPSRSLSEVMPKVTFVLSGFQNPIRGQLRDQALEMGAKYRPDWGKGCTHLVCAFSNTPKYQTVAGKGKIVTKSWITDCYKKRQLLPWRRYRLGDAESPDEYSDQEDEITQYKKNETPKRKEETSKRKDETQRMKEESLRRKEQAQKQKKEDSTYRSRSSTPDIPDVDKVTTEPNTASQARGYSDSDSGDDTEDELRKAREIAENQKQSKAARKTTTMVDAGDEDAAYYGSTDEDDPGGSNSADVNGSSDSKLPDLPDFLTGKHFFFYGEFSSSSQRLLTRYVAAYNGEIEDYMSPRVKFVITEQKWDDNFEDALNDNPDLVFVKPSWISQCHSKQRLVPHQSHIVVPQE